MKKQVILHVGLVKTASTTIQDSLRQNRKALAEAGLSYARFTANGKDHANHSLAFSYLFADKPVRHWTNAARRTDSDAERQRYLAEFEAALAAKGTAMFSAELVSTFPEAGLEVVRNAFERRGVDLRVVAIVRPAVSFLTSLTQQHVKSGTDVNVPYDKAPSHTIRRIESVFPNAEFYSFDEARNHPSGPTGFLMEKLGFRVNLDKVSSSNLSLSDNAVRLASFINRFAPVVSRGRLNQLRKEGDIRGVSRIGGPRFTLTVGEVDKDALQKEIDWLVSRFGESFSEDLTALPLEPAEWAPEQIDEALQFIRELPLALVPLASAYFQTEARLKDVQGVAKIEKLVERRLFHRPPAGKEATKKVSA